MKINLWIKAHTHLLVLLGLLGLFYFSFHERTLFFFLAFFAFLIMNCFLNIILLTLFGFEWFDKYKDSEKDELFTNNANKAYRIGIRTFAILVIACMILLETHLFKSVSPTIKYVILIASTAMAFSICSVIYSYLITKYEKESHNPGSDCGLK